MDPFPSTRETLLVRLRDPSNSVAWEEFLRMYEPLVYGLVRKRGLQDADARDLCQDVFRSVAKAIDRYEPQRGSFRKWLLKISRNVLLNQLASHRRHGRASGESGFQRWLELQADGRDDQRAAEEIEFRRHVFAFAANAICAEFTSTTWTAFWKTAVDGESATVVAKQLQISTGAVYIAKSRVLARLREQVRELEGE